MILLQEKTSCGGHVVIVMTMTFCLYKDLNVQITHSYFCMQMYMKKNPLLLNNIARLSKCVLPILLEVF